MNERVRQAYQEFVSQPRQLQMPFAVSLRPAVLEQDQIWIDGRNNVRYLTDLETRHLKNLEPFLARHDLRLRAGWIRYQSDRHYALVPTVIAEIDGKAIESHDPRDMWSQSDRGGNMDGAFDEWIKLEMELPIEEFLARRPLIKRIRELIKAREASE